MRAPLVTRPAADVPNDTLVEAWNRAYTGYLVDVRRDAAGLDEHVRSGSVDLDRSLVAFAGADPVGIALLGVRPEPGGPGARERGWVGGFGIAPSHRGLGLAAPLATDLLDVARRSGMTRVVLEVLTPNLAARRAYERVGFRVERRLVVLSGTLREDGAPHTGGRVLDVGSREAAAIRAGVLGRIPGTAVQPWGREWGYLTWRRDDVVALAGPAMAPTAAVVARVSTPAASSTRGPARLAVRTATAVDERAAREAVGALARRFAGCTAGVVNEPEGSPLLPALMAAGLGEVLAQHEMTVELSGSTASR